MNTFRELKEAVPLKEAMMTISHQIENINKEIKMQRKILEWKTTTSQRCAKFFKHDLSWQKNQYT